MNLSFFKDGWAYNNYQCIFLPVFSIITGANALAQARQNQAPVGYCYGSGNWIRCKKVIRFSLISGFILSCILCLFSYSFIDALVGAFLTNEDAFGYGALLLR